MLYVSGPPVFPLLNKHIYTHTLTHTKKQREMEQKTTQVKAEKKHNNGSGRGEGGSWIKQDRRMAERTLNKSRNGRQ